MRTQYCTAGSLDGFIATEDDSLEWLFPLGDVNDNQLSALHPAGRSFLATDAGYFRTRP